MNTLRSVFDQKNCVFFFNCFTPTVYHFKVILFIQHTVFWKEFMIYHPIILEKNDERNFNKRLNLACFLRSWLFWQFLLERLSFGFDVITISPCFVTSYDLFLQIASFNKFFQLKQFRNTFCYHTFHGPSQGSTDMLMPSAPSQLVIQWFSKTIFLQSFNIFPSFCVEGRNNLHIFFYSK